MRVGGKLRPSRSPRPDPQPSRCSPNSAKFGCDNRPSSSRGTSRLSGRRRFVYDPTRGYPRAVPYVLYRDPAAAARWITEVLGFCEAIRFTVPDGGPVAHIELERQGAVLTLGLAGSRFGETASITLVFVDDVDAACA